MAAGQESLVGICLQPAQPRGINPNANRVKVASVSSAGAWTVSVDGDELKVELATGGGKQSLIPISDSVFSFPGTGGTVKFVDDGKGPVTTLVLTIVEGDIPGKRK